MVRVGQTAVGTDGEPAKDEDDCRKKDSKNLEICMVTDGSTRSSSVEAGVKDGSRDEEEEDNGAYYAVGLDYGVIFCECREAVAHACFKWVQKSLVSNGFLTAHCKIASRGKG